MKAQKVLLASLGLLLVIAVLGGVIGAKMMKKGKEASPDAESAAQGNSTASSSSVERSVASETSTTFKGPSTGSSLTNATSTTVQSSNASAFIEPSATSATVTFLNTTHSDTSGLDPFPQSTDSSIGVVLGDGGVVQLHST